MKKVNKTLIATAVLLSQPLVASAADDNDMFGVWVSLTLQGDLEFLSPDFKNLHWSVMNQSRTREDSPQGSRFTENLLFSQVGYEMNQNASFWLGYVHDWIHPLNKTAYQESRPYVDFLWKQPLGGGKLTSRTRMEDRINQTTGDDGYRARQMFQLNHPLPFLNALSAYVGDEVMFYMNKTDWGKRGFTENRIFGDLSYQLTDHAGVDLGYMGQYVDNISGNNLFTHNLQANVNYHF